MKAYTSSSRFNEKRNFTGVFQQMGRVSLDADWNEEVLIRTADARRRSEDLAQGSPDDGFLVSDEHLLDPVANLAGWAGAGLEPGDLRVIPPSLSLDRRDPEGLPKVLRAEGHVALTRTLPTPLHLGAVALAPAGSFAAAALAFSVRFRRPTNDDDPTAVEFFLQDATGTVAAVPAGFGGELPAHWYTQRVPVAALAGLDLTRVVAWGIRGLPPRARTWLDGLRALDGALRYGAGPDFVVRGGDGTVAGAGRLLVDGVRTYLERDVRYSRQPDLPDPPALTELVDGGGEAHVVYLDAWEQLVTAQDDPFLREPALDGLDTTVRLQLLTQVKVLQNRPAGETPILPAALGGGRLSTAMPPGMLPDRYPPEPFDPCRDRCLSTESAAAGIGYTGAHNLHCRVEILHPDGPLPAVFLWSRDNGSTRLPLQADVPGEALTLPLDATDAQALRAGDVVVVSDRRIDRQPEGPRAPVLRVVRAVDTESGTVHLAEAGYNLTADPAPLPAGGPLGQTFTVADRAYVRRWDGADWLLNGLRYNLPDGITFGFSGGGLRRGEYWTFVARVEHPDGAARGWLETLAEAPAHGPVHHSVPLARITRVAGSDVYEDLRPRFLPLNAVRDRLAELADRPAPFGAFTLIVGDGVRTFGDIDQDLLEGVTADEALQSAVNMLQRAGGGSLYIRAGDYRLERPVLLADCHRIRILGDGEASALRVVGSGGAFILDGCGGNGEVSIERLSLVEAPLEDVAIGVDVEERPVPAEAVEPLAPGDLLLRVVEPAADFANTVAESLRLSGYRTRRAFNAVVSSLNRLRVLQRMNPGQPLEDLPEAARLLSLLRSLPHGVVTVADSSRVTLCELRVESREPRPEAGGILITGTCSEVRVADCHVRAAAAILAMPYGPYLSRGYLSANPKSGLDGEDLVFERNCLEASGDASLGIYLAEGFLRGVRIEANKVQGYAVGIAVRDRAGLDPGRTTGAVIAGNRLLGCTGVGIDVTGRGIEIADCTVENAAPFGLYQAGIRVAGSRVRVRDCRVALPPTAGAAPAGSPLGFVAGIVVGAGHDTGAEAGPGPEPVEDAEVAGCRIDGNGTAYPGVGVLVGGPQPALDVRIRGCSFRDLGDAAVRVLGQGGRTGRVRVEDNRIDRVALAAVPARADARAFLELAAPTVAAELAAAAVDAQDFRALLLALADSPSTQVAAPLDGVLRWVSFHTLRGAVIFDQVQEGEIVRNRINGVGNETTEGPEVRTSAIAVVGGTDVAVEGNQIENVVARARVVEPPADTAAPARPPTYAVLEGFVLRTGSDSAGRTDVHAAAVALRRMALAYGQGDDGIRIRLGQRIYAAMDALVSDLDSLDGAGATIAASLVVDADDMRSAQGRDDHTRASHRVRATLSRAAAFTAGGDAAREAWDAATQFDLAVVGGQPGPAATRLQDAAPELARGLPEQRAAIEREMARVLTAPLDRDAQLDAAATLGTLAEWRDAEYDRSRARNRFEIFGSDQTIARRFAEQLGQEAARLSNDADAENRARLETLRADKDALAATIRSANSDLADALEADWLSVERSPSEERTTRLRQTLSEVAAWSAGGGGAAVNEPAAVANAVQRMAEQGNAALASLVAKHLDSGVAKLALEPDGMKTKGLKVLRAAAEQMSNLVGDDPEAADLARKASAAIRVAAQDTQNRAGELARARTFLDALKRRFEPLVPKPAEPVRPKPVAGRLDTLLPALAGVVLSVRILDGAFRDEGLALFRPHFEFALELARVEGGGRTAALRTAEDALRRLGTGTEAQRAGGARALLGELERITGSLDARAATTASTAALVLIRAAAFCLDTAEDEAARLLRADAYLRERGSALSQSVAASLMQRSSAADLLQGLHGALERLALGEQPTVPALAPPFFHQRLEPADGVFGAGLVGRLRFTSNQVQNAARGITLLGNAGHALVGAPPADVGLVGQISGNRLDGCVLGGLDLRPSGNVALNLTDNEVLASAGVAEEGSAATGQAVAYVQGAGDLVVQGNVFLGNGHRHPRALLHELALDWRGEAVVRGNSIRHVGGGAGGAGLLFLAENLPSGLARRLSVAPFLGIEPPPALRPADSAVPAAPGPAWPLVIPGLLGRQAAVAAPTETVAGRLVQKLSSERVAPRLLTMALLPRTAAVATGSATRYLERVLASPLGAVLDFVRVPPYRKPPPPPPPPNQRSFHVEGNDVAAHGPALLLVGEERGDLLSASVVGNGLHSEGGTGAAYVRHAESVVFTGNRCQAPDTVTVVAIRSLAAAISVTGNVVLGREPVRPPSPPPRPVPFLPIRPGELTLNIPAGPTATLAIPVNAAKLKGSLQAFSGEAQKAFAKVLTARAAAEQPFLPDLPLNEVVTRSRDVAAPVEGPLRDRPVEPDQQAESPAVGRAPSIGGAANRFGAMLSAGRVPYSIVRFEGVQPPETVLSYIKQNELGSQEVEALLRGTKLEAFQDEAARKAFTTEVDSYRKTKRIEELEAKTALDATQDLAVAGRVFDRVVETKDTQAEALATMAKLFTAQGFAAERTAAEVQVLLEKSTGDAVKALGVLQSDIFGKGNATPDARKTIENIGLLEKVLADNVFSGLDAVDDTEVEAEPQVPPPDPYAHSLVILGGASVAVVGNATTAGTLVRGAQDSVELNV